MATNRIALGSLLFNTHYNYNHLERQIFCKKANLYSGQPRILTILGSNQGCTLKTLSALSHIGMPSLSVSVRNMEKSGLIRKGSGLRNQQLFLTELGEERAMIFHKEIDDFYKAYIEAVGEESSQALFDSLLKYNQFIETYMGLEPSDVPPPAASLEDVLAERKKEG